MAIENAQSGYGGDSTWDTLKQYAITPSEELAGGLTRTPKDKLDTLSDFYNTQILGMTESAKTLDDLSKSLLEGKIPKDVENQLRMTLSESSSAKGLFGQAGRALAAKDLGLTSLQMKQTGAEYVTKSAALKEASARLAESSRQFNEQMNLNVAEYGLRTRQANLQGLSLEQDRMQFNAKQSLAITGALQDLIKHQSQLQMEYAIRGVESTAAMNSLSSWISEFSKLI